MIEVRMDGLEDLRKALAEGLSQRRLDAAVATALTRTAVATKDAMRQMMPRVFDRPTPYTLNSLRVETATAARPVARVWLKDDLAGSGTPATKYLLPQVQGGGRGTKRLEVALRAAGALPDGWFVTPGDGASLDAYGNVSRGQIVQVLSQLRIQLVAGSMRNMSLDARRALRAQRRAGGRFFVVRPGGRLQPGIYQREFIGRNVTPVFVFVRRAQYRKRFDFYGLARTVVADRLQPEMARALQQQLDRLRAGQSGA